MLRSIFLRASVTLSALSNALSNAQRRFPRPTRTPRPAAPRAQQSSDPPAVLVRPSDGWQRRCSSIAVNADSYVPPPLVPETCISASRLVHYALAFLLNSFVRFQPLSLLRSLSNRPSTTRSLGPLDRERRTGWRCKHRVMLGLSVYHWTEEHLRLVSRSNNLQSACLQSACLLNAWCWMQPAGR